MCDRHGNDAAPPPDLSTGNYAGGERMLQFMAQYHCPRCDGAIAGECVESHALTGRHEFTLPRRVVRVACDHCNEVYEARFVLVGGYYQVDAAPVVCTDRRVRERMHARIEKIRGRREALADAR